MSPSGAVKGFAGAYTKLVVTAVAIGAMFGVAYLINNNYLSKLSFGPALERSQSISVSTPSFEKGLHHD